MGRQVDEIFYVTSSLFLTVQAELIRAAALYGWDKTWTLIRDPLEPSYARSFALNLNIIEGSKVCLYPLPVKGQLLHMPSPISNSDSCI